MEILTAAIETQATLNVSLVLDSRAINSVIGNNTWSTIYSAEPLEFNPVSHLASGEWITTQIDSFLNPSIVASEDDFIYPMPEWNAIERTVNYIFPPKAVVARVFINSSVEDSVANISLCTSDPDGLPGDRRGEQCNFRSAIEFCKLEILKSSDSNCSIVMPRNSVIELDTINIGEIVVADVIGELKIDGCNSTVRQQAVSSPPSGGRMIDVFASRPDLKNTQPFNFQLRDLYVSHFGKFDADGGAIRVQYVNSIVLEEVTFQGEIVFRLYVVYLLQHSFLCFVNLLVCDKLFLFVDIYFL